MSIEFTDNDFDDDLNIINTEQHISLIIGYSDQCHRCRELINNIDNDNRSIIYGKIDLKKNEDFAQFVAMKYNLNTLNVPLITLFKDRKFVKKIPNKFPLSHILMEIRNL